MIRTTVGKIGKELEQMTQQSLPVGMAFEILSQRARTLEEQVVVEVMKESFQEMCCEQDRMSA